MFELNDIFNERDARRAKATLEKAREFSSATSSFESARSGLSAAVTEKHRRAVAGAVAELSASLLRYEAAKTGNVETMMQAYRSDPGTALVVARIARGMSQAALAEQLGLREQQIQRYEADRYRSIGLGNYRRIANVLGVELLAQLKAGAQTQFAGPPQKPEFDAQAVKRVLAHADQHHWFDDVADAERNADHLLEYICDSTAKLGAPALLRTGILASDLSQNLFMTAWRARVVARAEQEIGGLEARFDLLDISWLSALSRLSRLADGPKRAIDLLREHGIVFIVEPQIPGLGLDGAALLIGGVPVVAMTIRNDRIDNFWFTLFHELAHIFLHHRMGLSVGFYDDLDAESADEIETEADEFASSALIPTEVWRVSAARISRDPAPVEKFAEQLGIHPAIVFGRIRMERSNYKIFSDRIGSGSVRKQFVEAV
jgi:HTH-type transcriptional regulator/antitoxin HigA